MSIVFAHDDEGFLAWVEAHRADGFFMNFDTRPGVTPDRLHRAACKHATSPTRTNYTTGYSQKDCSLDRAELERKYSKTLHYCRHASCFPDGEATP